MDTNQKVVLDRYGLKDQISSLRLRNNHRVVFWTWEERPSSRRWIAPWSDGSHGSSAGGGDNHPHGTLRTNNDIDVLEVR